MSEISNLGDNLYKDVSETAEKIGMKIISDDFCCQLMAWLLAYGGGNEDVIFNVKLNVDINTAQRRLNLLGGEIPNVDLLPLFQKYAQELNGYLKLDKGYQEPDWVGEINKRYNLKTDSSDTGKKIKTKKAKTKTGE